MLVSFVQSLLTLFQKNIDHALKLMALEFLYDLVHQLKVHTSPYPPTQLLSPLSHIFSLFSLPNMSIASVQFLFFFEGFGVWV